MSARLLMMPRQQGEWFLILRKVVLGMSHFTTEEITQMSDIELKLQISLLLHEAR